MVSLLIEHKEALIFHLLGVPRASQASAFPQSSGESPCVFPALGFPAGFLLGFETLALVSVERTEEGEARSWN